MDTRVDREDFWVSCSRERKRRLGGEADAHVPLSRGVQSELASTYLPCLLRTWTRTGQEELKSDEVRVWYLYTDYLAQVLGKAAGARLIRELPEESIRAYHRALQELEFFFDSKFTVRLTLDFT